jgi:hypothetical protein
MTDLTTAAEAARVAAETEASREIASQAAPDSPNPPAPAADPAQPEQRAPDPRDEVPGGQQPKPLERVTATDRNRASIAARFKEKRAAQGGQVEFHGNFQDPSQTYGPYAGQGAPQMTDVGGQRSEEQPPAQQHQQTTEAPPAQPAPPTSDIQPRPREGGGPTSERLIKVKVHGVEMHIPEDQVVAEAQKSLAAGNLLESAKDVLALSRGQMTDAGGQRPDSPTSDIRHPSSEPDPYIELAQSIQLEGAEAAGPKLRSAIESETAKARQEAAREAARQVRIENELAASQRALAAFEKAHPDLGSDEFARDAVTTQVQREINADLQSAVTQGILKELPRTQDERNGLHTQLRAFGAPVRAIGEIFEQAGNKYATWRGEKPAPRPSPQPQPQPQPNPAATAPRVELTTARQERRAAIPTQPASASVPPRPAAPLPEQTMAQRRSAAVMAMRRARGQITA